MFDLACQTLYFLEIVGLTSAFSQVSQRVGQNIGFGRFLTGHRQGTFQTRSVLHVSLPLDSASVFRFQLYPPSVHKITKPSVKPRLESLEDRNLLSANPITQVMGSAPIEAISQVASNTTDANNGVLPLSSGDILAWVQTMASEVGSDWSAFEARAQALADMLMSNLQGLGIGSLAAGQSLSGSGSGATTTTHEDASKQGVTPLVADNDTLIWNPKGGSNLASQASNWYDLTQNKQGVEKPGSTNPVIFNNDPNFESIVSNSPIEWDENFSLPSIYLASYTGQMTINDGLKVEATGNFSADKVSWLKVYFGASSVFQLDAGGGITSMTLSGNPSGQLNLAGGTTSLASSSGMYPPYQYNIGVNIYVAGGATLEDKSYVPLKLTNTNLTISVLGRMIVDYGSGANNTLLDATGFDNDYINVTDGGVLTYLGNGGVKDTFKNVPVLVYDGDFILNTYTGATNGGTLIVQGTVPNQANNASVYVTGDGTSMVQLATGDTLECDNNYYQDSGTLETMDATKATLQAGAMSAGTATIAGGSVKINQSNVGYGQLIVAASTLNFNAQLVVAMDASNPDSGTNPGGIRDWLRVYGVTNLQANSTLEVFVNNGPPAPNKLWVIIQDDTMKNIAGNFVMPITTLPQTALTPQVDPNNPIQYILKS